MQDVNPQAGGGVQSSKVTQVEKAFVKSLIFELGRFTGNFYFKMNVCTIQFFKSGEVNMSDKEFQTVTIQTGY